MRWFERVQRIDNRILYVTLAAVVAAPVFVRLSLPIPPTVETLGAYRAVESVPPGRLVMVQSTWDAGTIGECEGQCRAVIEHLMRRGKPFVIWTSNPASPPFYNRIIEETARRHGRVYGRDWADFGYKVPAGSMPFGVQAMARDFPGYMQSDVRGTPVSRLPVLRGVRNAADFDLIVTIGYNPIGEFIQFVQAVYGTRIVFGIAAINSTTTYSYIDSRQIVGMLVGARGGAEYEVLVGRPDRGVQIIMAQSFGHLLIVLLVIMANIAGLAQRRAERAGSGGRGSRRAEPGGPA
jgi:hypothetical protein